jgi:hypothetical protein
MLEKQEVIKTEAGRFLYWMSVMHFGLTVDIQNIFTEDYIMMLISGTVTNTVQLQMMNNKWQQKKESGDVLSKEERNERANWTQEEWLKHDIQEQAAQNRETSQQTDIDNKIMYGGTLTPEEEQYLEKNNPTALQKYKQIKAEKKSYEEKLKTCKTKDEVQRLKTETLGGYLSSMKKVENDPYIPQSEKLAKAQELLAKTRNIEKAEIKFMASAKYQNLPTEAEESEERSENREVDQEHILAEQKEAVDIDATDSEEAVNLSTDSTVPEEAEEDSDKKENGVDSAESDLQQEIEETYNRIERKVQSDDTGETDRKKDAENTVGKTINITV